MDIRVAIRCATPKKNKVDAHKVFETRFLVWHTNRPSSAVPNAPTKTTAGRNCSIFFPSRGAEWAIRSDNEAINHANKRFAMLNRATTHHVMQTPVFQDNNELFV